MPLLHINMAPDETIVKSIRDGSLGDLTIKFHLFSNNVQQLPLLPSCDECCEEDGYKEEYERVTTDPATRQKVSTPIRHPRLGQRVDDACNHPCWRSSRLLLLPAGWHAWWPQHWWPVGLLPDHLDWGHLHREKRSWECQVPSSSLLMELLRQDPCSAWQNRQLFRGLEHEVCWSCWSLKSHHLELLSCCQAGAVINRREDLLLPCLDNSPPRGRRPTLTLDRDAKIPHHCWQTRSLWLSILICWMELSYVNLILIL